MSMAEVHSKEAVSERLADIRRQLGMLAEYL
jgi:hypothetical protein